MVEKSIHPVDDIVVEVPLVNVSAIMVPDDSDTFFDDEESFDSLFDVKPRYLF